MENKERQKRYREKLKALRVTHDVTKTGENVTESVTDVVKSVTPVTVEWDREKYPDRAAWEVAVVRVDRARKYASLFPQFIGKGDLKYQELWWQYEHEGLPAVRKRVTA